jgi:hypothetical protein
MIKQQENIHDFSIDEMLQLFLSPYQMTNSFCKVNKKIGGMNPSHLRHRNGII